MTIAEAGDNVSIVQRTKPKEGKNGPLELSCDIPQGI